MVFQTDDGTLVRLGPCTEANPSGLTVITQVGPATSPVSVNPWDGTTQTDYAAKAWAAMAAGENAVSVVQIYNGWDAPAKLPGWKLQMYPSTTPILTSPAE
jgi:hypothetical protein